MALVLLDRAYEVTVSTGSGPFVLSGAVTEYQAIGNIGDGNTTYMTIKDQSGANWMTFQGTYTLSSNSVSVDSVFSSSAGGSLVSFGAGTKDIYIDVAASRIGTTQIGDIKIASTTPTGPGTWLETGKYYSKSSYPALASSLGNIPDVGVPSTLSSVKFPLQFSGLSASSFRNTVATNGTTAVVSGVSGQIFTTTDGLAWQQVAAGITTASLCTDYVNGTFIIGGASPLKSTDGTNWSSLNVVYTGVAGAAYGAGMYVLVGTIGTIQYSTDLINFTSALNLGANNFNGVIYANGLFVAYGVSGVLYTSSDGILWTVRSTGANTFNNAIYANSLFVVVGAGNSVYTSADGVTWTLRTATGSFQQVIYSNSLFVAVGTSGVIYTSTDGITWTARTSNTTSNLNSVTWNGTSFVAVGGAAGVYCTSSDGVTWTVNYDISYSTFTSVFTLFGKTIAFHNATSSNGASVVLAGSSRQEVLYQGVWGYTVGQVGTGLVRPITYNGSNLYVVVGSNGAILTSPDAQTWTARVSPLANSFDYVIYLNGNYIALGGSGSNTNLLTSPDATTWTSRNAGTSNILNAAAYGASIYVAVGAASITSSTDLVTWTLRTSAGSFNDVIYANGLFVAVGLSGACYTSADGITWTSRTAGATTFTRVIYANNLFVAVGSGVCYTSPDGITWTSRAIGIVGQINGIVWNGSIFCAVGVSGAISTSSDGLTWTVRSPGDTNLSLQNVMWDGTKFLAASGTLYITSTNGITWSRVTGAGGTGIWTDYLGGKYVTVGANTITFSSNGTSWTNCDHVQYVPTIVNKLYSFGSKYYALTTKGMYQSTDGITFSNAGRNTPVSSFTSMAYDGSNYLAMVSGSASVATAIYKSTDGSTWSLASYFNTNPISTAASMSTDLVYANGNFILGQTIATALRIYNSIYTSTDGVTWVGRATPYLATPTGIGSDGTNAIFASTSGLMRSTDGGITWNTVGAYYGAANVEYLNGYWYVLGSTVNSLNLVSSDEVNWVPNSNPYDNIAQTNGYVAGFTGTSAYIKNEASTLMAPSEYGKPTKFTATATGKKAPTRGDKILVPCTLSTLRMPNIIAEVPLYSYDTSTTFYVFPYLGSQTAYIYAGA